MRETLDRWRTWWAALDPDRRERFVDVLLALSLLVYTLPPALVDPGTSGLLLPPWVAAASAAVASLTMLVRRRWAWPSLVAGLACFLITGQGMPVTVAAYSMTAHRTIRHWQVVSALVAVGYAVADYYEPFQNPFPAVSLVRGVTLVAVPALVGTWVRGYRDLIQTLIDTVGIREEFAATRERRRIAAELHDTVTHAVTVMVLKAGIIQDNDDPAEDPELARDIEDKGVRALNELRELLTVLRSGDLPASAQGVDAIPQLVEDGNATGLRVTLDLGIPVGELPRRVEHAAYRVVQEGLNNARKHAPDSSVTVYGDLIGDVVTVSVTNTAPGSRPMARRRPPSIESGYGLGGLRERINLVGGTLTSGQGRDGGFELTARIPREGV